MNMQERARRLLEANAAGTDVEGGLYLAKALQQAKLDHTEASIARIDALLGQIRAKLSPVEDGFLDDPGRENFVLTLAFYLGEYVARKTGTNATWFAGHEAIPMMPPGTLAPGSFIAHAVGKLTGSWLIPLAVLKDGLFGGELTAQKWVLEVSNSEILQAEAANHVWQPEYLDRFLEGGRIPAGLAFEELLRDLRLDFSMESILRIDELLRAIRVRQPDYHRFVTEMPTANFSWLLGTYVARTIAQQAGCAMKWMDTASAQAAGLKAGDVFETMYAVRLAHLVCYPVVPVHEVLFAQKPSMACMSFVKGVLAEKLEPVIRLKRNMPIEARKAGGWFGGNKSGERMVWQTPVRQAGFLAAHGAFMLLGGIPAPPALLQPTADGKHTLVDLSFFGDGEAIQARAMEAMQGNPEGLPYQAYLSEIYIDLPRKRMDGILVHLACYAQPELVLAIGIPYTPSSAPGGFKVHPPAVVHCSAPQHLLPEIAKEFFAGLDSNAAIQWREYEDDRW